MSTDNSAIHIQRLTKLTNLIASNRSALVTQPPRINDTLLTAIEDCFSSTEKCDKLEINCWNFIHNYCSSFGKLIALNKNDLKVILKHLKPYVQVKDAVVQLQDKTVVTRKRKRQGVVEDQGDKREPDTETWKLHHSALKALNSLLIAANEDMDESDFNDISYPVVGQLMDIYRKQDNLVGVYTVLELREDLLRLFRTLLMLPLFVHLRPLQPAQVIFVNALNWEQDSDLKLFCRESLLMLMLIVKPVIPVHVATHSITVEAVDEGESSNSKDEVAADVNGVVTVEIDFGATKRNLTNGQEKPPDQAEEAMEDVITINDDSQDEDIETAVSSSQLMSNNVEATDDEPTVVDTIIRSPIPRKLDESVVLTPGSSNYATCNESINNSQVISSPVTTDDVMTIIDELK